VFERKLRIWAFRTGSDEYGAYGLWFELKKTPQKIYSQIKKVLLSYKYLQRCK